MEPEEFNPDPELKTPKKRQTRRIVATPEEYEAVTNPQAVVDGEKVTELTAEERASFRTFLTCGKWSKTISVLGHPVVVQTLRVDDELRIGLYTKKYEGSGAFSRAYQAAVCAAGIRTVDGEPLYESLQENPDPDVLFASNVSAVEKLYPIAISPVYRAIMELEAEYAGLAQKLGKSPG